MTILALYSAKGSPGATTIACVLGAVWPVERPVIVAECDPSGGDLAVRFGLSGRSGIASYLFAARGSTPCNVRLVDHCQPLPGGLDVLVGAVGLEAAAAIDVELADSALGSRDGWDVASQIETNTGSQADVIIDCGRLLADAPGQQQILDFADVTLLVMRPDAPGIAHARMLTERTRLSRPDRSLVVTIGSGPFPSAEIRKVLGLDSLVEVPEDRAAAAVACGGPGDGRAFRRSRLVAVARQMAAMLADFGVGTAESAEDIAAAAEELEPA